jgi:aminoglycoside phosphotransferase (APT) family kinase protein
MNRDATGVATQPQGQSKAPGAADLASFSDAPPVVADRLARDPEVLGRRIAPWLAERLGCETVTIERPRFPQGAGMSNETLLFSARYAQPRRARTRPMVLRVEPSEYQLFRDVNFEMQFKLLSTLANARHVRVPGMLWFESDPSLLGRRFFIMEQMSGRVPVTFPPYNAAGMLFDARPRERERAWTNAVQELCRIHRTPTAEVAFVDARSAEGEDALEGHFRRQLEGYRWAAAGREVPFLEDAIAWLEAALPVGTPDGLAWGDARIGNMMFGPAFDVVAVLDWEQASLGGALCDLGWWLLFDKFHSDSMGLRRLEGLGARSDTIALWEALTGLRARDLEWFEVFAALQVSSTLLRKSVLDRSSKPGANISNNAFTRLIADIRGVPQPPDLLEQFDT